MGRQSDRLILRRVYAFLKSRKLHRAAHALEKEAQLRFDCPRVGSMIHGGRWRSADEYVSAFLGDRSSTPEAAATLFLVRFQRFLRALRRGDEAWARRYLARGILPVLRAHPERDAAAGSCLAVLRDRSALDAHRDDAQSRRACNLAFLGSIFQNDGFVILTDDDRPEAHPEGNLPWAPAICTPAPQPTKGFCVDRSIQQAGRSCSCELLTYQARCLVYQFDPIM